MTHLLHFTCAYSLIDINDPSMSDWDSAFYGKPICIDIPSNMSLCNNINYKQMKMPNLLGHDSVDEVVYQSSAWMPLLSLNCHRDAQLFLCSMFAPVCVEQAQLIYPCRSLCESVRQSCESQMLRYSYPWPSMFDCGQFPENGLCVPTSDKMVPVERETTKAVTITTRTTTGVLETRSSTRTFRPSTQTSFNPSNQSHRENIFLQDPICYGCDEDRLNMEQIVHGYCNSDIVMRGRIQTIRISRLDLVNLKPREKLVVNKINKTGSLYLKISRRNRKIFKGVEFINRKQLRNYVKELVYPVEEYYDPYELNLYLMSNMHLKMSGANASRAFEAREPSLSQSKRKRIRNLIENRKFMKRFENRKKNHCICHRLKKGARRINSKYLFMANILNSSNLKLNQRKRRNQSPSYLIRKRNDTAAIKLVYLTNVIQWNKARPFIDFLENDLIDKTNMCQDIQKTAREVIKADNRLFFF